MFVVGFPSCDASTSFLLDTQQDVDARVQTGVRSLHKFDSAARARRLWVQLAPHHSLRRGRACLTAVRFSFYVTSFNTHRRHPGQAKREPGSISPVIISGRLIQTSRNN
jgi:hypothetical protein